jgi:hypothetical protein
MTDDDLSAYGLGWAFYKSDGTDVPAALKNDKNSDLEGFAAGFVAALADDERYTAAKTIKQAFLARISDPSLCADLVRATHVLDGGDKWLRWPNMPIE